MHSELRQWVELNVAIILYSWLGGRMGPWAGLYVANVCLFFGRRWNFDSPVMELVGYWVV